jgi:hypothetical protein
MMWGLVAVAVLFGALSLAAWKLCSPPNFQTRSVAHRRVPAGKAPHRTSPHPVASTRKLDTPFPH